MNRRDLEQRVDEELATEYYHASHADLPVGAVLKSRGSQGRTPALVDDLRPPGTPRRNRHLFMVKDPACLEELGQEGATHVYRVTPAAPVVKADFGWLTRAGGWSPYRGDETYLKRYLERKGWIAKSNRWTHAKIPGAVFALREAERAQAAMNYWSGEPSEPCYDEYLTMAFRVEEKVK